MSNWIGYAITVNCGEPLGCYQGTILEADGTTITLTKAFRNGFPYPKSQVTLNAADIKDLKIIESRPEPSEQTHSTVAVTKGLKKAQRATVCENLQANPTSSGNQAPTGGAGCSSKPASSRPAQPPPTSSRPAQPPPTSSRPAQPPPTCSRPAQPPPTSSRPAQPPPTSSRPAQPPPTSSRPAQPPPTSSRPAQPPPTCSRPAQPPPTCSRPVQPLPARSKPIDIQASRASKNGNHAGSYGNTSSTPKARGGGFGNVYDKARRRNEACFGEAADVGLDDDFDFEGNLALFNKRELWEQIRNSHRPDVVRQADDLGKFRHDENVLGAAAGPRRAIRVPDELRAARGYVTDAGLRVPAAAPGLRARLWAALRRLGLADAARTLLARAAADVALRLAGGGRRLEPRNAHQAPTVVALVGAHGGGAAGLQAARLLASHGARAAALLAAPAPQPCAALARELAVLAPAGVALATELAELPRPDLLLLALHDPILDDPQEQYEAVLRWAGAARGACVCLEPPAGGGGWAAAAPRAAVLGGLPAALPASLGVVYLADVCVPAQVFAELQVQYEPPFGASPVLALHPADD